MRSANRIKLAIVALSCLAADGPPGSGPGMIVGRFADDGDRARFLTGLKAALADGSSGYYRDEFASLVTALEHEPPPPAGYDKPADRRTADESIAAWVYELRDDRGWNGTEPRAASHLIAAGPAAMDSLVAALDDDTPTRAAGDGKSDLSPVALQRRSDSALACIENISGITFFRRTRGGQFHNDPGRPSAAKNVRDWWRAARGKSQADGVRVQLGLWRQYATFAGSNYIEADLLFMLAQLEPPDRVIGKLREWCVVDPMGLNSPVQGGMLEVDPQFVIRQCLERLRDDKPRDGDYAILLKYGDKAVYQHLCRRAANGRFDPGAWGHGGQAEWAAKYGKNWAIPIVAAALSETKMTGSRSTGGPSQSFSAADEAVVPFQRLTGKDFGYRDEESQADRLAAIGRARDWWTAEGRAAMVDTIAADHPSTTDGTDLLWTDAQIDDAVRRPDPAALPATVFSYRIRQTLLDRLATEPDPATRLAILEKLDRPGAWQVAGLLPSFESDPDMQVRRRGADLMTSLDLQSWTFFNRRLEPRDAAVAAARRAGDKPDPNLVLPVVRLLIGYGTTEDRPRIVALARLEPARSDAGVRKFVDRDPKLPG